MEPTHTGWVFRIEEFFDFHNTPDHIRLRIVSFHMEGRAASWFQWAKANHLLSSWPEFIDGLLQCFGTSLYEDHHGALSKLTQTSTVAEFQTQFEEIMNRVSGVPENLLISFFLSGLRPDVRREMSIVKPTSLMESFSLAKIYEARLEAMRAKSRTWFRGTTKAVTNMVMPAQAVRTGVTTTPHQAYIPPPKQPPLLPTTNIPIRRMSQTEM